MRINKDGSIDFIKKGVIYKFAKDNYDIHIRRRPIIQHKLKEIEDTILNPDCITRGPNKSKKSFYKCFSYQNTKMGRNVTYWQIPTYVRSKKFAKVATCMYITSPNQYIIHRLETVIWRKQNSQI